MSTLKLFPCRNFAREGKLGYFKKRGGVAASSISGSNGRQCLITLVILRGGEIDTGGVGGGGRECPLPFSPAHTLNTPLPKV